MSLVASTRYVAGVVKWVIDPYGSRWDIVALKGDTLTLRRGMGVAGTRRSFVLLGIDGTILWATWRTR